MRVFLYKKVSILLNQTHSSHKKKDIPINMEGRQVNN